MFKRFLGLGLSMSVPQSKCQGFLPGSDFLVEGLEYPLGIRNPGGTAVLLHRTVCLTLQARPLRL